ncbi:SulA-like leucine-rich domain-containing protein [Orbaceae bacterium ac157xtp]
MSYNHKISDLENKFKNFHLSQYDLFADTSYESPLQQVLQQHGTLLRLLDQQNKWQLWLSTKPMLKRSWIKSCGLNENKVLNLSTAKSANFIELIIKALLSKTCSYVVACIDSSLNDYDKHSLQQAVKTSGTHLFIVDEHFFDYNDFMTMNLTTIHLH